MSEYSSDESILADSSDGEWAEQARIVPRKDNAANISRRVAESSNEWNKQKRQNGRKKAKGTGANAQTYSWETNIERSWDVVKENAAGVLESSTFDTLLDQQSRRRKWKDTSAIQRGVIRHVCIVIDLSEAMLETDFRASWLQLTLEHAKKFVVEFFDHNPISQMGIFVTRNGLAERLSPLSSSPQDHVLALSNKKRLETIGQPSIQNSLEMCQRAMSHVPSHGSKEIIVIMGSLTTVDPGNIFKTIDAMKAEKIRVSMIGLAAEVSICKEICSRTGGQYAVTRDDQNLKDLLLEFVYPPPVLVTSQQQSGAAAADLILMGFPELTKAPLPGLCACHSALKRVGFTCPRCMARVCDIPTECPVCSLTLVSSPHLARTFRSLFPAVNYNALHEFEGELPQVCSGCNVSFPEVNPAHASKKPKTAMNVSPYGRYQCPKCHNMFCLDCDVLIHEDLGFCPGCM